MGAGPSGQDKQAGSDQPEKPNMAVLLPKTAAGWRLPDNYEVKKCIGKGSYGSVSECYDRKKEKLVAAKQMRELFHDLIDCKRILRELAILAQLNSNHVVHLEDIVIPDSLDTFNELYIVLEICDSDMKKLIKTDVNLELVHINTLLYNLLVGLKYIHSAGVYHRDLKPANCLVNQDCSVKICDFGLARAVGTIGSAGHPDEIDPAVGGIDPEAVDAEAGPVVPSTLKAKRAMTQHVVTRWYRAPELILLQKNYTEAVDIWSIGCIFGELLQMLEASKVRFPDRGPLFPGNSCFPLSPDRKSAQRRRGKNDQLEMIFAVLGTPTEDEVASLEGDDARKYLRSFSAVQGEGISARLKDVGADALDLLNRMLHFSPKDRCGVEEALAHPLLASIRDQSVEKTADKLVRLGFNDEGNVDEKELRRCFGSELKHFRERSL